MGSGISIQDNELIKAEMTKPGDGSDISTIDEGKREIIRLRKLMHDHASITGGDSVIEKYETAVIVRKMSSSSLRTVIKDVLGKMIVDQYPWDSVWESGVVTGDSKMTAVNVLDLLRRHQIVAVPVFDEPKKKYLGFFNVSDLMHKIVKAHHQNGISGSEMPTFFTESRNLGALAAVLLPEPVVEMDSLATRPFVPLTETDPFLLALCYLCGETKARKISCVPVLGDDGRIKKLITQSGVVEFLARHCVESEWDVKSISILDSSPASSGFGLKEVFSVLSSGMCLTAFEHMVNNNVSSVAVVNSAGALEACVSDHDVLLLLQNDDVKLIGVKVMEFLERVRKNATTVTAADGATKECKHELDWKRIGCLTVKKDLCFRQIIKKLASSRARKVFIVDNDGKPIGRVTLRDILRLLILQR